MSDKPEKVDASDLSYSKGDQTKTSIDNLIKQFESHRDELAKKEDTIQTFLPQETDNEGT